MRVEEGPDLVGAVCVFFKFLIPEFERKLVVHLAFFEQARVPFAHFYVACACPFEQLLRA